MFWAAEQLDSSYAKGLRVLLASPSYDITDLSISDHSVLEEFSSTLSIVLKQPTARYCKLSTRSTAHPLLGYAAISSRVNASQLVIEPRAYQELLPRGNPL
jgi:hypothetical protein